jgi:hypothetical protein
MPDRQMAIAQLERQTGRLLNATLSPSRHKADNDAADLAVLNNFTGVLRDCNKTAGKL